MPRTFSRNSVFYSVTVYICVDDIAILFHCTFSTRNMCYCSDPQDTESFQPYMLVSFSEYIVLWLTVCAKSVVLYILLGPSVSDICCCSNASTRGNTASCPYLKRNTLLCSLQFIKVNSWLGHTPLFLTSASVHHFKQLVIEIRARIWKEIHCSVVYCS